MIRSLEISLFTFFIGALFMVGAALLGNLSFDVCWNSTHVVECTTSAIKKEVGFAWAVNWSVGLTFLFPLFIYCACETANQAVAAIRELAERRMIVTEKWGSVSPDRALDTFKRRRLLIIASIVAVAVLSGILLVKDFGSVVGPYYTSPELIGSVMLRDQENEIDWSVAAPVCEYLSSDAGSCANLRENSGLNWLFAATAYFYLAWAGSVVAITFMISIAVFATYFSAADFRKSKFVLIPDLKSTDQRKGFEVLEGFFIHAVLACFVLFVMGYLVTLQNVYLRTDYRNVVELVLPFLAPVKQFTATSAPDALGAFLGSFGEAFKQNLYATNINTVAVLFLGILFALLMVLSTALALRTTARKGTLRMADALNAADKDPKFSALLNGMSVTAAKKSLQEISFWPLKWPTLNSLLAWLVVAIMALVSVTLGFYLIGLGLAYVVSITIIKRQGAAAGKAK